MAGQLSAEERNTLLQLARQTLESAVQGAEPEQIDLAKFSARLCQMRATFVTLLYKEQLRGCVGAIEPTRPLVVDVRDNVIAAAFYDHRFSPVQEHELDGMSIEISLLSPLELLNYKKPKDLLSIIRPGVDGVLIRDEDRRATFLPKVWEKISEMLVSRKNYSCIFKKIKFEVIK